MYEAGLHRARGGRPEQLRFRRRSDPRNRRARSLPAAPVAVPGPPFAGPSRSSASADGSGSSASVSRSCRCRWAFVITFAQRRDTTRCGTPSGESRFVTQAIERPDDLPPAILDGIARLFRTAEESPRVRPELRVPSLRKQFERRPIPKPGRTRPGTRRAPSPSLPWRSWAPLFIGHNNRCREIGKGFNRYVAGDLLAFLARERSLPWAILRRRVRWKGRQRQWVEFGRDVQRRSWNPATSKCASKANARVSPSRHMTSKLTASMREKR
jgi:hypothetical protein